jgi:bifunctional non-homologous end joining protein LigD
MPSIDSAIAKFVEPMAALVTAKLPEGEQWVYELKFDGYRALALKHGNSVRLVSRKGNELTRDYPDVVEAVQGIAAKTALLDGEIVALDAEGRPSFQMLQHRASLGKNRRVVYYAFDLLNLNGRDVRGLPLEKRKELLAGVIKGSRVLLSSNLDGPPDVLIEQVAKLKLEGIIAKRRDSKYEAGKRSGAWQKFKVNNEQEFVIGGYRPDGKNFDALLVGYYQGKQLMFAGKVRAGFTPALRASVWKQIKLVAEVEKCPFVNLPNAKTGRWNEGVTAEDMAELRWLKPKLVAQIAFTEWTRDGSLRHSKFIALRTDKDAKEVGRE